MIINYYNNQKLCTKINVNEKEKTLTIENFTESPIERAFGINENPTWQDFEEFLESRCFPRNRHHIQLNLKELGLSEYNPMEICKKTNGRHSKDQQWMEFEEEPYDKNIEEKQSEEESEVEL